MKRKLIVFLVAFLVLSTVSMKTPVVEAADQNVSVKLIQDIKDVTSLNLLIKGTYKETFSGKSLVSGKKYTVKVENGELSLYDGTNLITKSKELSLQPAAVSLSHLVTLYGAAERTYMGKMNFKAEQTEQKQCIIPYNVLPIEEYVQGVVPGEMNSSFSMHALRAQAIAARTYVTYKLNSGNPVVDDTTSFQRYAGYARGYNDMIKAVFETKGKVLTYNGKAIEALFSASNGGFTETNIGAWPGPNKQLLPYFPAKADAYDNKTPWKTSPIIYKNQISVTDLDKSNPDVWWNNATEKNELLAGQLKQKLTVPNSDVKIIGINSFTLPNEKTDGKRVKLAIFEITYVMKDLFGNLVTDTEGEVKKFAEKVTLTGSQLKYGLGEGVTSTYVTSVQRVSDGYQLTGIGNGHGVGMSQLGANVMALKGKGFREILAFYYPGTVITNDKNTLIPTSALQVRGIINYEGVNIRKSPSTKDISLGKGKLGQTVNIIGKKGTWFKVKVGNTVGFMDEEYVNVQQTLSYKNGMTPITSGRIQSLGTTIVSKNNTLYVPIKGFATRYGMKYSTKSSSFTVVAGSKKVAASYTSKYATVNGKRITLSLKPERYYNNVYVPLSFLKQTGLATDYYEEKSEGVLWINK